MKRKVGVDKEGKQRGSNMRAVNQTSHNAPVRVTKADKYYKDKQWNYLFKLKVSPIFFAACAYYMVIHTCMQINLDTVS